VSFGLSFDKLLIIGIIAVFVLGPERLPYYASQLARLVRRARDLANGAKDRMREEMGPEFDDIDWKKLDPRQYDPRRIIREALIDSDEPAPQVKPVSAEMAAAASASGDIAAAASPSTDRFGPASPSAQLDRMLRDGVAAPFDSEAT
jgi:sec-independent protein translocase protein TatB